MHAQLVHDPKFDLDYMVCWFQFYFQIVSNKIKFEVQLVSSLGLRGFQVWVSVVFRLKVQLVSILGFSWFQVWDLLFSKISGF